MHPRILLILSLIPLLAACGPRVVCDGDGAQELLAEVFKQGVAQRFKAADASDEARQAVDAMRVSLAGLREVSRADGTCKGEGIASLNLRADVASRLTNDTAQYMFSELGTATLSGDTLRLPVQFTVTRTDRGVQAESAALMELAAGGVGFTLQTVSGQMARSASGGD